MVIKYVSLSYIYLLNFRWCRRVIIRKSTSQNGLKSLHYLGVKLRNDTLVETRNASGKISFKSTFKIYLQSLFISPVYMIFGDLLSEVLLGVFEGANFKSKLLF